MEATSLLDTSYSRWIIEPLGYGKDAKGNTYSDKNFWNLCEAGATTAALYYWQQLTGRPDVTGTAGYFLDPYEAEGAAWPSPGPRVGHVRTASRIGTYWSGSDAIDGYTAHARGYIAYIGMAIRLPGWESAGEAVYADSTGKPLYPTIGAPRTNIQAALNWEASGQAAEAWAEFWYTSVMRFEPTMARDLRMAVMLDVGRDGVPVVAELDTHDLPNWQAGSATPHIRHSVAIVGYDNTANPPTYTYLDTCGRACNSRGGNRERPGPRNRRSRRWCRPSRTRLARASSGRGAGPAAARDEPWRFASLYRGPPAFGPELRHYCPTRDRTGGRRGALSDG